jgi:metal-dependent HD superfamily phosphatase/phosphodiesterase
VRRACIDIGSNTTRLLVADCAGGRLNPVHQERAFTYLGWDRLADGAIAPEKLREVARVVAAQARTARRLGAFEIRAIATAAIRGAPNRDELVTAVRRECGLEVEILTGEEEARLAFVGAAGTFGRLPSGQLGVVDVGGGSCELVVGSAPDRVAWSASFPLGSGDLARTYLHSDPPLRSELAQARHEVESTLGDLDMPRPLHAAAVGGSAASLVRLAGRILDAAVQVRAPTRGNRRLELLLDAVNADEHIKALWHVSAVNASRRLGMSDHSWVHIQIVLNIALRLARLLFRRGVRPSLAVDYGMSERDAEVVIAAACLLHCVGMAIHRDDHERFSLFLSEEVLGHLLAGAYAEPERTIVASEALHAIIAHRRKGHPLTVEAGIVRVADALDMARGRSRVPFEAGHQNIHSLSAYAIEEVKISAGRDRAVRVEIEMSNSAGIFQVDELLATKLRGSGLEEHIEVIARIDAEHEQRLIPVFRI